jgi:hypothetical protein
MISIRITVNQAYIRRRYVQNTDLETLDGRAPSCGRLPGHWLLRNLSDDTLNHSHRSLAVAIHSSGWDTFLWLGHWSNTLSPESIHTSHSTAQNTYKQCDVKMFILQIQARSSDVGATRALSGHLCVCGWDTSGSYTQWSVCKQPKPLGTIPFRNIFFPSCRSLRSTGPPFRGFLVWRCAFCSE